MLFADRLDVMNSGQLPPPLTVEKLRVAHESLPGNPLLAQSMYLRGYIERMGTGTVDMIRRCAEAGLPEPEFVARGNFVTTIRRAGYVIQRESELGAPRGATAGAIPEVTPEVIPEVIPEVMKLLSVIEGEMRRTEIQAKLRLKDEKHFRQQYQQPAIAQGLLEMTIPAKPNSRLQKYRLTAKGRAAVEQKPDNLEQ